MRDVIHDITHREAIFDVNRLIQNKDVKEHIERALGEHVYNQFHPWLLTVARSHQGNFDMVDMVTGQARRLTTISALGFKATTTVVQQLGHFNTINAIGLKYTAQGLAGMYLRNPVKIKESFNFIFERSPAMRFRSRTFDREVNDIIKKQEFGALKVSDSVFFSTIAISDMIVSGVAWLGAYKKAMAGKEKNIAKGDEKAAIAFADRTVRITQAAGGAKDLSRIQTGSGTARLLTIFYSYFNVLFNQFNKEINIVKGKKGFTPKVFRAVRAYLYLVVMDAILGEIITGRGPEDDEDLVRWTTKKLTAYPFHTIVGVRDMVSSLESGYGYTFTPVAKTAEGVIDILDLGLRAVDPERDITTLDIIQAGEGFSTLIGLPTNQIKITVDHFINWSNGDSDFSLKHLLLKKEN